MKRKFAFILMGNHYDPEQHQACFETRDQTTRILTVPDYEAAKALVADLYAQGYGAIELCGAFDQEKAQELIRLTGGKMVVGYVVKEPGQDALAEAFFTRG